MAQLEDHLNGEIEKEESNILIESQSSHKKDSSF